MNVIDIEKLDNNDLIKVCKFIEIEYNRLSKNILSFPSTLETDFPDIKPIAHLKRDILNRINTIYTKISNLKDLLYIFYSVLYERDIGNKDIPIWIKGRYLKEILKKNK